jgi:uncharacterized phosphosugar-binding protein
MPADHFIRHPNKKNLFDIADICIDDYNPVGDSLLKIDGCDIPFAPVSNIVDFLYRSLVGKLKQLRNV